MENEVTTELPAKYANDPLFGPAYQKIIDGLPPGTIYWVNGRPCYDRNGLVSADHVFMYPFEINSFDIDQKIKPKKAPKVKKWCSTCHYRNVPSTGDVYKPCSTCLKNSHWKAPEPVSEAVVDASVPRRVFPSLTPLDSAKTVPVSKPMLSDEEVVRGFQQIYPGVETDGLTRMQMLAAIVKRSI